MLASAILVVTVLVLAWRFLFQKKDPLDSVPGPPALPFFGNSLSLLQVKPCELFNLIGEYRKIYGDRFLLRTVNRRILQISNPDDAEIVLSSTKNISKNFPYSFLSPWLGTGLLLSTDLKWHERRRILTPAFHFNILKIFFKIMEEKSRVLLQTLERTEGSLVDLAPLVSDFTLHTICETAMGTQLDSDKSSAAVEYKKSILSIGDLALNRLARFWLHSDLVFRFSDIGRRFRKVLEKVHGFADGVIFERKRRRNHKLQEQQDPRDEEVGSKKRLAMMDLLLDAEDRGDIDLIGVRDEVNTFMFEGHDTTAMALTFTLMLLADHPDVQDKIQSECSKIFGTSTRSPDVSDLSEMKYLEAVIKESLRLYPSVPFIGRKVTDEFMLGDLLVPKGAEIAIRIFDLHRNEEYFPDPEEFKPERFFGQGPAHPFVYVPFSAGPRNCIGRRFAMMELKIALSGICRWFRLEPETRGCRPRISPDLVLRPLHPIRVSFIKR